MDDSIQTERQVRAARNESLYREVNERLEELAETFKYVARESPFACECADMACLEHVYLTIEQYEAVRANPTHFLVRPGHVLPEVEEVISTHETYVVVAKHGAAADVARKADPRGGEAS